MKYKKLSPSKVLKLRDMSTTLQYGSVKSDKRIQVVMPAAVVDALDQMFPEKDRSAVLTSLAIDAILDRHYFADRPDFEQMSKLEQQGLNTMLEYLEEREA